MANRNRNPLSASIPEGDELGLQEAVNYVRLHADPVFPDATIEPSEQASEGED